MPTIVLVVPREASGARLDRFVTHALAATDVAPSRSELQRWIDKGRVTIDGEVKKASEKLREGARVEVDPDRPEPTSAQPDRGVPFDVIHLDDDLVVVCKPPGVVVHPARGHEGGTLVNGLLAMGLFRAIPEEERHDRPGIVHRLDKGTSGVMVVARTPAAREHLKRQFADHSIDREYEAICAGDVRAQVFSTLHGRHPKDRLRFTTRVTSGKRAVTHVEVLARLGRATHVCCRLETGRTHQIRVHLAENGTPVLGDPLYAKPPRDPELRALAEEIGHQALHAKVLGFEHPRGGRLRFEADPPPDFQRALGRLRSA